MSTSHAVLHLAGSLALLAAALAPAAAAGAGDAALRADLEAALRRSVFFGHQSVGGNVLEGLAELARQEGVGLRLVEATSALGAAPATWAHGAVADNGDPLRKVQSFEGYFAPAAGAAPDVAFMKFCYVDFHQGTDVAALFARYQAALRELQARHPRTTFVHLTAPLTTTQGGLKALAKRLLGRETSEVQNARREAFNALVRQAYQGREPLFDLASLEATGPDGRPRTVTVGGRPVPVMDAAYSDDGGHLNAEGRRHVARALVAFLAALPPAAPAAGVR